MANEYTILKGGEEFLEEVLTSIDGAKKSIKIQFSTFEHNRRSVKFFSRLIQARKRGVRVQLILDYYTDIVIGDIFPFLIHKRAEIKKRRKVTYELRHKLEKGGIEIIRTAPVGMFFQNSFMRNHKKIIVVDERICYLGGFNISDHNLDWYDYMFKLEGKLAKDISQDFDNTFSGKRKLFKYKSKQSDYIITDSAGNPSIRDHVIELINEAKKQVVIETPYFIGKDLEDSVINAGKRGVDVKIIIPFENNKRLFRRWHRAVIKKVHGKNVKIYGFKGGGKRQGMTHVKLGLVDNAVFFGSCNLSELEDISHKDISLFSSDKDLRKNVQKLLLNDINNSKPFQVVKGVVTRADYFILLNIIKIRIKIGMLNSSWREAYA